MSILLAQNRASGASCCNIANICFCLQYNLYNADMPSLLQAALAQQILATQSLQTALSAAQDKRQAAVVSVGHFLNPLASPCSLGC